MSKADTPGTWSAKSNPECIIFLAGGAQSGPGCLTSPVAQACGRQEAVTFHKVSPINGLLTYLKKKYTLFYFIIFNPHLRICLLIREREEALRGGGEKNQCERKASIGCLPYSPVQRLNPQSRYVSSLEWDGIYNLLMCRMML